MKNRIMKLAQALSLLALAGMTSVASADTIPISDFDGPLPGDFVIELGPGDTTNGNCLSTDCLLLNPGSSETLSRSGMGTFTLESFWFSLQGAPSVLRVTNSDGDYWDFSSDAVQTVNNGDFGTDFTDVVSITWSNVEGQGSSRVDELTVTFDACTEDCQTVPEPGTLALLGLGLLGLSVSRRRKV